MRSAHLGPICTSITSYVTDDLREVLSIFHDEHMAEHFEVGKVGRERLDLPCTCQKRMRGEEDEKNAELTFNEEMKVW
jgi:hypothetical protein